LRIFVREDGRPYPTILFWLFFVPVLIILLAGGCAVLNRRAEQTRVAGALTGTPPPAETAAPSASATPRAATLVPTATQFVYDDPGDWEFVERTDPTVKKYLDLQDWQREQVWHAFEEFWNLYNRNEGGLPDWATIEPHIRGSFLELVRGEFDRALESGRYVYLVEKIEDIPHRAMVLESPAPEDVKVKIILVMERSYQVQYRDVATGAVLEEGKWLPYRSWSFIMSFRGGNWVAEEEIHELFPE
jgi:hypothetical protein